MASASEVKEYFASIPVDALVEARDGLHDRTSSLGFDSDEAAAESRDVMAKLQEEYPALKFILDKMSEESAGRGLTEEETNEYWFGGLTVVVALKEFLDNAALMESIGE